MNQASILFTAAIVLQTAERLRKPGRTNRFKYPRSRPELASSTGFLGCLSKAIVGTTTNGTAESRNPGRYRRRPRTDHGIDIDPLYYPAGNCPYRHVDRSHKCGFPVVAVPARLVGLLYTPFTVVMDSYRRLNAVRHGISVAIPTLTYPFPCIAPLGGIRRLGDDCRKNPCTSYIE